MTIRPAIAALLILLAAGPAFAAVEGAAQGQDSLGADWRLQQGEARAKVKSGAHVPLDKVVAEIRRRTPGRLLDAGIESGPDGRSLYRVRWAAADGRRIDFMVDAATGQIVSGG